MHFKLILQDLYIIRRYPVLNSLNILDSLVSIHCFRSHQEEYGSALLSQVVSSLERLKEQIATEELYDSPQHFLPSKIARSCYLVADCIERLDEQEKAKLEGKCQYLRYKAKDYFAKNRQMYTMREAYYKTIGDMYYLYDDFNDRAVHHNRAVQMLNCVVNHELEKQLEKSLRENP